MSLAPPVALDNPRVSVALWSDITCPWCFIGARRLHRILAPHPEINVEWHWRPFQLHPDLPPSGTPWSDFAQGKYGESAQAQPELAQIVATGAGEGIDFRFDRITMAPNTVDAHRLLLFAEVQGRLTEAMESFYFGYFTDGANLSDADTLVGLAARAGVDADAARALLQSDRFQGEVAESQREAGELGMQTIPFSVFRAPDGHQWGLSGVAEPTVLVQALGVISRHLTLPAPPVDAA